MSKDPEKKDDPEDGSQDSDVQAIIEKRVVEHIVSFKDGDPKGNPVKPPVKTDPNEESMEDLLARLQSADKAREEAEAELKKITDESKITSDELKQRKSQLEALALKEFEEKKEILVSKVRESQGDEKADEVEEMIKSGQDIDRITRFMTVFDSALAKGAGGDDGTGEDDDNPPAKPAPKGKVSGRKVEDPDVERLDSGAAWVKKVYDAVEEGMFLRAMSMPYDANKLAEAETQRNNLLKSFLRGERNREKITRVVVMQCRDCGRIITGGETQCPNCEAPIYHRVQGGIS